MSLLARRLDRRRLVAATAALSGVAVVPPFARARQGATPTADSPLRPELPSGGLQPDGSWVFTDDRGVTSTLPTAPTKVVAYIGVAAALYDLGFDVVGYFGDAFNADGSRQVIAGDLPLDAIANLGDYTGLDVEQIVALGAELFVGLNWDLANDNETIWLVNQDALAQIAEFTQVIAIAVADGADVKRTIDAIANLAVALGADLSTPDNQRAVTDFNTATADLQTAIAEKPDLTALFITGTEESFWIGGGADITYFERLGLKTLNNPSWVEVAWEQVANYPCDLIVNDARALYALQPDDLKADIPTFSFHPAVTANQIAPWHVEFVSSHKGFTPVLTEIATALRSSRADVA